MLRSLIVFFYCRFGTSVFACTFGSRLGLRSSLFALRPFFKGTLPLPLTDSALSRVNESNPPRLPRGRSAASPGPSIDPSNGFRLGSLSVTRVPGWLRERDRRLNGKLVSRSTRDRHRKEDMRRRTARAWPGASDGRPPPPLFLDALQNNFNRPVCRSKMPLMTSSSLSSTSDSYQGTSGGVEERRILSSPPDHHDSDGRTGTREGTGQLDRLDGGSADGAAGLHLQEVDCMDLSANDLDGDDPDGGGEASRTRVVLAPRRHSVGGEVVVDEDDEDEEASWAERFHEGTPEPAEEEHVEPYYIEDDFGEDTGHADAAPPMRAEEATDATDVQRHEQQQQHGTAATDEAQQQE
ncbi:hypothetical protein OC842_007241 [Tilletia horrida]|uniref:Uncharacterized protein n=1 Tax=Tilletia horrida TaxID=155126 RepID=A0AAN6G4J9_9BASI|nr:hypothetical protein OC842_007241 [Tilletia horrida]